MDNEFPFLIINAFINISLYCVTGATNIENIHRFNSLARGTVHVGHVWRTQWDLKLIKPSVNVHFVTHDVSFHEKHIKQLGGLVSFIYSI